MFLKEVDKAEVTCLVDNNVDVLLPNTEVAHRPRLRKDWYYYPLIAEHGFCAAITVYINDEKHRLLLDSGLDPLVASHNADALGYDLSFCKTVIASHGHIDHAGGLLNLKLKMNKTERMPLFSMNMLLKRD